MLHVIDIGIQKSKTISCCFCSTYSAQLLSPNQIGRHSNQSQNFTHQHLSVHSTLFHKHLASKKKAKKPEEKSQNALSTGLQARRREAPYYWIVRPTSCKRQVDQTALKSNLTTSDPFLSSKPTEYIHSTMTTFRSRPHSNYLQTLTTSSHLPLPQQLSSHINTKNPQHSHSQSLPQPPSISHNPCEQTQKTRMGTNPKPILQGRENVAWDTTASQFNQCRVRWIAVV